jgi:hypothetical protein
VRRTCDLSSSLPTTPPSSTRKPSCPKAPGRTGWFANWASGLDVLDVERDESPIELRWLVNQKRGLSTEKSASAAPLRYRAYALQPAEKRLGFKAHAPGYMMSNLVGARDQPRAST